MNKKQLLNWSAEQVLTFAPDAPTARRGKDLATKQKWNLLAQNEKVIWGECKSSGPACYQTQVDLNGPAFNCNCPSRKYPCKHSLGLLLLHIKENNTFQCKDQAPQWVASWMEKRLQKSNSNKAKEDTPENALSGKLSAAAAKNREKRLQLMASGLNDLEFWLTDLIRQGLAETEGQALSYWQNISARMVDSQLGGLGKRIKALPLLQRANTDWPDRMLYELAQFYLLIKGFRQLDKLPPGLQAELLSIAGFNTRKEELKTLKGTGDEWKILGVLEGIEDNLNFRRSWLYGLNSKQSALMLEYSFGEATFNPVISFGACLKAELVYYPSSYPVRAILKDDIMPFQTSKLPQGHDCFETFFEFYSDALSRNPWIYHFSALLEEVTPVMDHSSLVLVDKNRLQIEVSQKGNNGWKLMALSGGLPLTVFGEWTGEVLILLSVIVNDRLIKL